MSYSLFKQVRLRTHHWINKDHEGKENKRLNAFTLKSL